jgi:2-dehydro-3-deoxy-D-arabinonate dehydratase
LKIKLAKFLDPHGTTTLGSVEDDRIRRLIQPDGRSMALSRLLHAPEPDAAIEQLIDPKADAFPLDRVELLAPIDEQEVWAAGVTYRRSQTARMEESAAAASCYDRVYTADRPELFLKATAARVCGPKEPLRIRSDSHWTVPEPELVLVLAPDMQLVGFTIGNDMSSRDIEGENPLYLPQAKIYRQSCSIGPWITLGPNLPEGSATLIDMTIERAGEPVFVGSTSVAEMRRTFEDLIDYLGRDNEFPNGVMLLTGTGIVPPNDFSLQHGDLVDIRIDGLGTLSNPVVKSTAT